MKISAKKGGIAITVIAVILMTAKSFIGQEETPNNSGFKDKMFQSAMEHDGWRIYNSWCVFFAKLVWDISIPSGPVHDRAMKLITGNSQSTLANFLKDTSGYFYVTDSAFTGGIIIWQDYENGKPTYSGHAGICIETHPGGFTTIEGNTNNDGGREGYIVALKHRKYNRNVTNGLRYKKCISIKIAA